MSGQPMQVQLPDGQTIWARVSVDGPRNVGSGTSQVLALLDVEELRRTIQGVAGSVRQALDDLTPDQVQVEFGLELAIKTGKLTSMLAEAGATGAIKVALTWNGGVPMNLPASVLPTGQ